MSLRSIEFDIGRTKHGQPVRLVYSKSSCGGMEWTLFRDQANQRDDSACVTGLTDENILEMAEAVKTRRKEQL
jgi:hypothetical protein